MKKRKPKAVVLPKRGRPYMGAHLCMRCGKLVGPQPLHPVQRLGCRLCGERYAVLLGDLFPPRPAPPRRHPYIDKLAAFMQGIS